MKGNWASRGIPTGYGVGWMGQSVQHYEPSAAVGNCNPFTHKNMCNVCRSVCASAKYMCVCEYGVWMGMVSMSLHVCVVCVYAPICVCVLGGGKKH